MKVTVVISKIVMPTYTWELRYGKAIQNSTRSNAFTTIVTAMINFDSPLPMKTRFGRPVKDGCHICIHTAKVYLYSCAIE